MKLSFLKFVYKSLLTGMPFLTYNSITKNTFLAPLDVKPYSTYLNFRLDQSQVNYLDTYINKYTKNLSIVPIELFPNSKEDYFLSVNIYNCTSPLFLNDEKEITRCEINTYVKDNLGNYGTLIIDYLSNEISMDPINVIKFKDNINYIDSNKFKIIDCCSKIENICLNLNYSTLFEKDMVISDHLIKYTDKVYYKNGIYDKVFYDSLLTNSETKTPPLYFNFSFIYKGLNFTEIDSIFYFKNTLNFVGGMWANIFDN